MYKCQRTLNCSRKKKISSTGKAKSPLGTSLIQHPPLTFPRSNHCPQWDVYPNFLRPGTPAPSDSRVRPNLLPGPAPVAGALVLALVPRMRPAETLAPKTAGAHVLCSERVATPGAFPHPRLLARLQGPAYRRPGVPRTSSFVDKPQFPFLSPPRQSR